MMKEILLNWRNALKQTTHTNDTIYALSTPVGGAIAVIRISGSMSISLLRSIFTGKIEHRYMAHGCIHDAAETLDEVMGVAFHAPNSYTGEDMAEVYAHGGHANVQRIMELIAKQGARAARAGEFTERAFLAGKLDLTQAEAVMDLIQATAERSAKSAVRQMEGQLSERIHAIEEIILDALSGIDAAIDYPDEMEDDVTSTLPEQISKAKAMLTSLIEEGLRGRVLREGASVVIMGKPNVGKSSLLNALLGEEKAIVTAQAGTTRDIIEGAISISGVPVRLYDTAGLRQSMDLPEQIGISRAKRLAEDADLLLLAFDGSAPFTAEDAELIKESENKPRIAVVCKGDLPVSFPQEKLTDTGLITLNVSVASGEGLPKLRAALAAHIAPESESALVTNARHVDAMLIAQASLGSAASASELDLTATDLRGALAALGAITGRTVDAEVIERIFARFCVGK